MASLGGNATWVIPVPKAVGGDSAINSMSFDRGSREDYDSWEHMGNKGWGFDALMPYFKKCETFHPPTKEQTEKFGITYDPEAHGTDGPLHVKFASYIFPQYSRFPQKCSLDILLRLVRNRRGCLQEGWSARSL